MEFKCVSISGRTRIQALQKKIASHSPPPPLLKVPVSLCLYHLMWLNTSFFLSYTCCLTANVTYGRSFFFPMLLPCPVPASIIVRQYYTPPPSFLSLPLSFNMTCPPTPLLAAVSQLILAPGLPRPVCLGLPRLLGLLGAGFS